MTSEKSRLLAEDTRDSEMATQDLLASYSVTPQITPARTPRTPAAQDVILQELLTEEHPDQDDVITPDAAELDEENIRRLQEKEKQDFLLRSQAVQRSLPHPNDVNTTILRGAVHPDQKIKSLYEAEKLIKKEMLHMLHYELANFPTPQAGSTAKHKAAIEKAKQVLDEKPYEVISLEDMQTAHQLLEAEMEVVKHSMNHGEISLDTYSTVWEE
ncbi:cell division cycle 5-like protein isoform X2 [Dysidea avara]|uniref:cell division cycle 5-like protein isoform X2 n=1 Tax=Dysidea avara TaxID=196820 RepID=UPI003330A889